MTNNSAAQLIKITSQKNNNSQKHFKSFDKANV